MPCCWSSLGLQSSCPPCARLCQTYHRCPYDATLLAAGSAHRSFASGTVTHNTERESRRGRKKVDALGFNRGSQEHLPFCNHLSLAHAQYCALYCASCAGPICRFLRTPLQVRSLGVYVVRRPATRGEITVRPSPHTIRLCRTA
jgi:hypothetical protein